MYSRCTMAHRLAPVPSTLRSCDHSHAQTRIRCTRRICRSTYYTSLRSQGPVRSMPSEVQGAPASSALRASHPNRVHVEAHYMYDSHVGIPTGTVVVLVQTFRPSNGVGPACVLDVAARGGRRARSRACRGSSKGSSCARSTHPTRPAAPSHVRLSFSTSCGILPRPGCGCYVACLPEVNQTVL